MAELNRKVGEMRYDGLITGLNPPVQVGGRIIAQTGEDAQYTRGTLFAKSGADNKLYILGSGADGADELVPDCILCDDTSVGAGADACAAVYTAGCFDPGKMTLAEGYTISDADKDALRMRNIVFKAPSASN